MRYHYTVRTYAEFRQWAEKFARDEQMHGLVVFGWPGSGKSQTFTRKLADRYLVTVKGRLTAFQLFRKLKKDPDALFLFDDTRRILSDGECVNLLMALTEHQMPKVVQWNTSTLSKKAYGSKSSEEDSEDDDPNLLVTTTRIVLVINKLDEEDEDLEPLFSRCVVLRFLPSKEEVHRYVGEWFLDPTDDRTHEIYNYIGGKLPIIPVADVRDYTKSLANYEMGWQKLLHEAWTGDEYLTAALQVINDETIPPGKAQVERFGQLCGGSRAQFFRLKRKLMPLR